MKKAPMDTSHLNLDFTTSVNSTAFSEFPAEILNQIKAHLDLEKQITIGANIYLTLVAALSNIDKHGVMWGGNNNKFN